VIDYPLCEICGYSIGRPKSKSITPKLTGTIIFAQGNGYRKGEVLPPVCKACWNSMIQLGLVDAG
jgi:hypothetical protein